MPLCTRESAVGDVGLRFAVPFELGDMRFGHLGDGWDRVGLNHPLYRTGQQAGLRRGELIVLRWSHCDFAGAGFTSAKTTSNESSNGRRGRNRGRSQ